MDKYKKVTPILPPKYKAYKDIYIPKSPKIPKEPTEEEILKQEENLDKLWRYVHGHKMETKRPKSKNIKNISKSHVI